ncbi:MAG: coiled-coil domain-containing protein [Desulfobulbaceae bacterium]
MNKYTLLLVCVVMLGGCAKQQQPPPPPEVALEPIVVYQSLGTNYLLSCLHDSKDIGRGAFDFNFEVAEKELQDGKDTDTLRFICLSLNEKADHKQLKRGLEVLEQYIKEHPDAGEDVLGVQILADRLNQEILNRWSAWRTLLNDKKKLSAEVESLSAEAESLRLRNEELQKQIEQLKNIDDIMKSRETEQR